MLLYDTEEEVSNARFNPALLSHHREMLENATSKEIAIAYAAAMFDIAIRTGDKRIVRAFYDVVRDSPAYKMMNKEDADKHLFKAAEDYLGRNLSP